jgi:hypothetical protein
MIGKRFFGWPKYLALVVVLVTLLTLLISASMVRADTSPVADAGGPYTVEEGSYVTLTGSGTDPQGLSLTYAWDLNGDGVYETPGQSVPFFFTLYGPKTVTVALQVCNSAGLCATATTTVTIVVAPPTADAGGPYTVNEGSCVTLTGSSTDPQGLPLTYAWDLNGDGVYETPGQSVPFCAVDGPKTVPVKLQVCNSAGLCTTASTTVTINNVAPTVGSITAPVDPVQVNTVINASANFTDPGILDTHIAVWDWDDGTSSPGVVTETNGSGSAAGSRTYAVPGVYTITLTVTDKDGGSGQSVFQYVVVYDPTAGFVTGGGDSPPGAYSPDPMLTGKATFGFVAKYLKGKSVPAGETEFQFHVAGLNFNSTSYQWLVIAGAKAQYKGYGTINGSGDYGFILSAIDGQIKGGGGGDRFRIKIWDKATNQVIYDNQMGSADDAAPATPISGGSIVIHATASVATAGVSSILYLGYILAGLLGCLVIAAGLRTFFMWGGLLPRQD